MNNEISKKLSKLILEFHISIMKFLKSNMKQSMNNNMKFIL